MKIGRTLLHSYIVSVESSSFHWNNFKQTCKLKTSLGYCFRNGIYNNRKPNKRCPTNYMLTFHWMINWHKTEFPVFFCPKKKKMKQSFIRTVLYIWTSNARRVFFFDFDWILNELFLRIAFVSVPTIELNWICWESTKCWLVQVKLNFLKRNRETKRVGQNWLHNGYKFSKPIGASRSAISNDGKWKDTTKKPISWYAATTRWKVSELASTENWVFFVS